MSKPQADQPKNLVEAVRYLEKTWSDTDKESLKNLSEDEAEYSMHFSTGLSIRNEWLYNEKDTSLVDYFHSIGVFHPDEMSSIILSSLHRVLNGKKVRSYRKRNFLGLIK